MIHRCHGWTSGGSSSSDFVCKILYQRCSIPDSYKVKDIQSQIAKGVSGGNVYCISNVKSTVNVQTSNLWLCELLEVNTHVAQCSIKLRKMRRLNIANSKLILSYWHPIHY